MQVYTSITEYKKRVAEKLFFSKRGFVISNGVFHLGLEEVLRVMSSQCDYRTLFLKPDLNDKEWEISDDFEDRIKPFNLDCLVFFGPEDKEFFMPRNFKIDANFPWVNLDTAFFYLQVANIFNFDKFYVGQKDFFDAKLISDLIHDFNLQFELEVVSNVREKNGVLCSSNFTRYGNSSDPEFQVLNKTIDFTLRMIQNGQKDVLMLEKLIKEYVSSFKKLRLQKIVFLDAVNLTEIGFIDGTRKIFFQLEALINGKKYIDNIIL